MTLFAAALVAGAGFFAYAENGMEELVVASAEESLWFGPDEIVEATAETEFRLGPDGKSWPWMVGDDVAACVKDGTLVITGSGAMSNFVDAAAVPWADVVDEVAAVTIAESVILGRNALAALADDVLVTTVSSIGSMKEALGVSAESAGAISGAEFERIEIADGKAYLGVSVYTNSEVMAKGEGEGWGVATNGVIVVPAPGKQGFFYLMSKPGK